MREPLRSCCIKLAGQLWALCLRAGLGEPKPLQVSGAKHGKFDVAIGMCGVQPELAGLHARQCLQRPPRLAPREQHGTPAPLPNRPTRPPPTVGRHHHGALLCQYRGYCDGWPAGLGPGAAGAGTGPSLSRLWQPAPSPGAPHRHAAGEGGRRSGAPRSRAGCLPGPLGHDMDGRPAALQLLLGRAGSLACAAQKQGLLLLLLGCCAALHRSSNCQPERRLRGIALHRDKRSAMPCQQPAAAQPWMLPRRRLLTPA